jgi:hypothetical protein
MSARAVTDREAVLRALEACRRLGREAFLAQHGFGRAKRYELIHQGEAYDPPAIVAVAHGEQHGRVLRPGEVKGAAAVLQRLGFEIVESLPPWREDEMVLGLEVYLRHRGKRLGKGHRDVLDLSDVLRRLGPLQGEVRRSAFRNPAGVEQQLGKFLSLDPQSEIEGRGQPSALHRAIWDQYARKPRALRRRVAGLMNSLEALPRSGAARYEPLAPEVSELPRAHGKASREELSSPLDAEPEPERPDAAEPSRPDPVAQHRANAVHRELRLALAGFLQRQGFACRNPPKGRQDLRYDLLAMREGLTLLVEIKSLPPGGDDHGQLRPGLGQVLWYRGRWTEDCEDPCVAVLHVEREPADAETWLAVCKSVSVVLMWPDRLGMLVEECALFSVVSGVRYGGRASSGAPPILAPPPKTPRTRRR